jgi:formate dehydrogenase subunit gamma
MKQDAIPDTEESVVFTAIVQNCRAEQDNLLPVLHAVQDALGYIPDKCVAYIASTFNLSRAEVHGVVTFYHYFRTTPPARHRVQICCAEACQSMGAEQLVAHAKARLGCDLHGRSADGQFMLEPVYCLGQCAVSPAMMLDDAVHARVTPPRFDRLIAKAEEEK